jgi:6-phospho-beta-glucosidase
MQRRQDSGIVVTVIGAGSTYTPMIVKELASRQKNLPTAELRLYDIDRKRLAIVAGFCRRLWGEALRMKTPGSLQGALDRADFVLSQFRVGQLQARHRDIKLGLRYGLIGQETTGVGGFAKALRTIPATLAVCRAMRKHAARDAWLINFTNPSAIITETVLKHGGVRCIGLCNGPLNLRRALARSLGGELRDVRMDYVGSNHLGWVKRVLLRRKDVTARVRRLRAHHRPANIPALAGSVIFERAMGLPYNGYLRYYYYTDSMLHKLRSRKRTRAQEALAIERVLLRKYAGKWLTEIPDELRKRGGGGYNLVAADIVDGIANDRRNLQVVNVQNRGAVDGVKDDAVVEITSRVSRAGASPVRIGALAPQVRGLLQVVKAYEELAVKAGVNGDLEAALHALVIHPLGPGAERAAPLLKDLLRINARYLPQFTAAAKRRFFRP